MAEFACNISRQASTMTSLFNALLNYHPQISYEDNRDLGSKSQIADENVTVLRDLIKELKENLAESQELQAVYYNKYVKKHLFRLRESVRFNGKHIKTNQNQNLEHKYLDLFEILEAVGK